MGEKYFREVFWEEVLRSDDNTRDNLSLNRGQRSAEEISFYRYSISFYRYPIYLMISIYRYSIYMYLQIDIHFIHADVPHLYVGPFEQSPTKGI